MRRPVTLIVVLMIVIQVNGAEDFAVDDLGASIRLPTFSASISMGFNYDLLRAPTDVSFDYPQGFFGFNLPVKGSINLRDFLTYANPAIDSVFADSTVFSNGEDFRPTGEAQQNPNLTVRVDVPMMGGVASFSNTQNFFLGYENILGNPDVFVNPSDSLLGEGISFLMRGTISVPLNLSLSWETMTFGYAYKINKYLTMALNLHRHLFTLDLRAKIDVNLLGKMKYETTGEMAGPDLSKELDYPSEKVFGRAYGHYDAEVWTPTIGIQAWRFTLTSRFGFTTRARGDFLAKYSLPFFIDPETFQFNIDFTDPAQLADPQFMNNLDANAVDSVTYKTEKSGMLWKMPTGITLGFDIIPEHLGISYTKTFGEVQLKLEKIIKEQRAAETGSSRSGTDDSLVIDMGVSVDHVIMMHINVFNAFVNLGIFAMDFRYGENTHLIGSNMPYMTMGESAMFPILNIGSAIGTKLRLHLELDVLPLPALKTGIYYFF